MIILRANMQNKYHYTMESKCILVLAFVKPKHRAQFFVLHQGPQNIVTALYAVEVKMQQLHTTLAPRALMPSG